MLASLRSSLRRFRGVAVFASLAVAAFACSGNPTSTVTGVVTYKGKNVTAGTVSLIPASGIPISAEIQNDGRYIAAQVPVGEVLVLVLDPPPAAAAPTEGRKKFKESGGKGAPKADATPAAKESPAIVPKKYADAAASGLRCTVKGAETKFDILLSD